MRNLIRRFLHNIGLPVSKFSTLQERFDEGDAFLAEYRSRKG
jgi:hypothetical protein